VKPSYTIDGLACRDFATTVAEFNRVFAEWWGEGYWDGHLDVLNDIMDWVGDFQPYTFVWAGSEVARQQLGHQAMIGWLSNKLDQCKPGIGGDWRKQLAQAERGRGPTLFDWLVEIISGHEQIELRLE
jgi:hypothetical protein